MNYLQESHNKLRDMLLNKGVEVSTIPDKDGIHDCDRYLDVLEDYDIDFKVLHNTAITATIEVVHNIETKIMIELLSAVKLKDILVKATTRGEKELYEDVAEDLCLM